jgi:hypothetical protein
MLGSYTEILPKLKTNHREKRRGRKTKKDKYKKSALFKAKCFLKHAPIFKVDLDLDSLTTGISDLTIQQDICDKDLGESQPAQVFSGQWVDKNGKKIAFYIAERWYNTVEAKVSKYIYI